FAVWVSNSHSHPSGRPPVTWRLESTQLTRGRDTQGLRAVLVNLPAIAQAVTNKSLNRQPRLLGAGTEDAFSRGRSNGRVWDGTTRNHRLLLADALNAHRFLAVTLASGFINSVARRTPDYAQRCNEMMQLAHPNGWSDSERSKTQMVESRKRARLVLIASDGEWAGRSLESVLELNGYSVVRVERGRRALELARRTPLDAIFLDAATTDMGGIEVCRALRDDPLFDHSTPIIITSAVAGAHRAGAAAFAAGAWEYCSQPFDVETLMLKLATFVRAADTVRDARGGGLLD